MVFLAFRGLLSLTTVVIPLNASCIDLLRFASTSKEKTEVKATIVYLVTDLNSMVTKYI